MKFLWPFALILLALIPLAIAFYILMQRRRRRYAVRFSSLSLIREAVPAQSRLRRYLPPTLFLLALTGLLVGLARPVMVTAVPAGRTTIILALDVSLSMMQTDIQPNRLAVAKKAALSFIEKQQNHNQIGIVAYAGIAQVVQPPTTDGEELEKAIQNLTTGRGTAVGEGILTAINTIAEFNQNVVASSKSKNAPAPPPIPAGTHVPDIIVLLTDGANNTGFDPLEAAQQAADRGLRVYTIGYGTTSGAIERGNNFQGGFNRGIDEPTMKKIAALTGGEYFAASSAGELEKIFASLPTVLFTRDELTETSVYFAAFAALLAIISIILAQLWHPLP